MRAELSAHKSVLEKSPILGILCLGPFTDPACRDIELPYESPDSFRRVLQFLYRGDYTPLDSTLDEAHLTRLSVSDIGYCITIFFKIYALAHTYEIPALKLVTENKITAVCLSLTISRARLLSDYGEDFP